MKYSLQNNHKILCGLSAGVFALWMLTEVVLFFVLEDIGTAFLWAVGMNVLWSAIALSMAVHPCAPQNCPLPLKRSVITLSTNALPLVLFSLETQKASVITLSMAALL